MTTRHVLVLLIAAIVLGGSGRTFGEEAASSEKTWEEVARESGLSEADVAALEKNRILVSHEAYKQVFSAYLSGGAPLFITSDSLLNAYHVLYAESILRLENARASRLPDILRLILDNLDDADDDLKGNAVLAAAAKRRAMLVPGIALRLMDDSFRFEDDELNAILDQEAKKIARAEGVEMPGWLGKPDASFTALDYSRYKPRGFYTCSEQLARYFRAVSWLQSIPFRIDKDEELLAILMLGNSISSGRFDDYTEWRDIAAFFRSYSSFIGAGDDWDLMTAADEALRRLRLDLDGDDLQEERDQLREEAEGPLINDQIRFAPDDPGKAAEPHFRVLSACRTPGAILFQRTTDLRRFDRAYPTGLEVATSLGSVFARDRIADPQKAEVLEVLDSCQTFFEGESLYLAYLDALRALLDRPEEDAPDFMKNEAWRVKSCNTVLAGWVQLRHTWTLQAKQTVHYLGMTIVPEGFVEPEPEFFSRMADLADTTEYLLELSGAFDPDLTHVILSFERLQEILEGVENEEGLREKISDLPREDVMALELPLMLMLTGAAESERGAEVSFKEKREWIDTVAEDVKNGRIDRHPLVEAMVEDYEFDLEELWERFEEVSRRLEAIAHKQLRGADLNESEAAFMKGYGAAIAEIMLYGGNSYLTPRDDSPRVVDVYANPEEGGYLHVGISRARKLYVLYPWQGETILCTGAVMPYYEFVAEERLTDEVWKERLDSQQRPPIPEWVAAIVRGGRLSKPELKDDD